MGEMATGGGARKMRRLGEGIGEGGIIRQGEPFAQSKLEKVNVECHSRKGIRHVGDPQQWKTQALVKSTCNNHTCQSRDQLILRVM